MKNASNKLKFNLRLSILLLGSAIMLNACSSGKNADTANKIELTNEATSSEGFDLTSTQFAAGNMELGKLEKREFHKSVKANGMFDVPPQNKASVSAYFGGYVKEISLLPGEIVHKGHVLFTLENPEYVQVQQDFLEAKSQLAFLKSDFERQQNLVKDNVTSEKNYLKAESDFAVTRVRYESLRKRLTMMQIDPDKLDENNLRTTVQVTAPIGGFISEVKVSKGMLLRPEDVAVTIVNTDHLHLELNVFEKDIAAIKVGQAIKFNIQNNTKEKYDANVHLINQMVDPEHRTISIHGHLKDEGNFHHFTPGMYVESEIFTNAISRLALPEEAIVNIDEQYFVLIQKSMSSELRSFERKEVIIGAQGNGFVEIENAEDFDPETVFLTKGAYNLIRD